MFPRRRCLVFPRPLHLPEEAEVWAEFHLPRPIGTSMRAGSEVVQLLPLLPFLIELHDTLTVWFMEEEFLHIRAKFRTVEWKQFHSCTIFSNISVSLADDLENRFSFQTRLPAPEMWKAGPKTYPSMSAQSKAGRSELMWILFTLADWCLGWF